MSGAPSVTAAETWFVHAINVTVRKIYLNAFICEIQAFVLHLQVLHHRGKTGNRDNENGNEIMFSYKLKDTVVKVRLPSSLSHVSAKKHSPRAVFKLTFHFCLHCVASASPLYHFHYLPPCCLSAPLLPSSAPSLHPRGQWPRLIAVSIAHGFPLLLRPDFCSKRACSWVRKILLSGQAHKGRGQMGILEGRWRNSTLLLHPNV